MLSKKSLKKKSVKQALLEDQHEGGGLDAKALARLPNSKKYGEDEDEVVKPAMGSRRQSRSKSRASDETRIDGLEQFDQYGDLFRDLTLRTFVDTELDVINVIITYDSKHCIAMVNDKDEHFELRGYDFATYDLKFTHHFKGRYIKMNQIE